MKWEEGHHPSWTKTLNNFIFGFHSLITVGHAQPTNDGPKLQICGQLDLRGLVKSKDNDSRKVSSWHGKPLIECRSAFKNPKKQIKNKQHLTPSLKISNFAHFSSQIWICPQQILVPDHFPKYLSRQWELAEAVDNSPSIPF